MFFLKLFTVLFFSYTAIAAPVNDERDLTKLRSLGAPNANTIYIFTSATCPHCADFHEEILPEIIKKFVDTGRAQILFVDDASDNITTTTAMLSRCLPPEKSEQFMKTVFKKQKDWVSQKNAQHILVHYASGLGMNQSEADLCLGNAELRASVKEQWKNLGRMYQVRHIPLVALRQGSKVRTYTGADKRAVLNGMENDFQR